MAKFSNVTVASKPRLVARGPIVVRKSSKAIPTHEGAEGLTLSAKSELYMLAVSNMVGEPTFYESPGDRDSRFVTLVHKVALKDPAWMAEFVPFLRRECNMRSAALVVAMEAAKAILSARAADPSLEGPNVRQMVSSGLDRPDEPAEALGYWLSHHGRPIPPAIKRGIADAAVRLYDEFSVLKYDGESHSVRMGDVVNLTHPRPKGDQSTLFRHLLERRHGHFEPTPENLQVLEAKGYPRLAQAHRLNLIPQGERREWLLSQEDPGSVLAEAGFTWERMGGWIDGGMDAAAWEAIIPQMGYMARLRNIRNFEQAGVSPGILKEIADYLADPERVAKSRQFPYRFYSAWKASGSIVFGPALEAALVASLNNIPRLPGKTLVMIDTSGSMTWGSVSARSSMRPVDLAALFGCAINARNAGNCTVVQYATSQKALHLPASVLRGVESLNHQIGSVGSGTNTWVCIRTALEDYGPHDRIIVLTDMQDHPAIKAKHLDYAGPIYVWDLSGAGRANLDTNQPGRYLFAGFTDQCFKMIPLLEAGFDQSWPWE